MTIIPIKVKVNAGFRYGILSSFFAVGLFGIYRLYLLGPNPYEQGFMYTAAVASSEGMLPHRDFFMQYGPITSIIQGVWLHLFGTNLIQLQYVTMLSLLLISILLFALIKEWWGFKVALLAPCFWALTGPHGNPWSSLWSNLFAILGVAVIKASASTHEFGRKIAMLLLGSTTLIVGVLTRVHVVAIVILVSIWISITLEITREFKKLYFVTILSVSTLFALLLHFLGMLIPWFEQCIKWPVVNYVGKGPGISVPRLADASFIAIIPITLLLILALRSLAANHFKHRFQRALSTMLYGIFILFLLLLLFLRFQPKQPPLTLRNPEVFLITFSQKFSYFFTFTILCLYGLLFFYNFVKSLIEKSFKRLGIFDAMAVGMLSQLYPLHDSYHIFVITPGLLVALAQSNHFRNKALQMTESFRNKVVYAKTITAILLCFLILQNLLLGLRIDYKFSHGILDGIYSRSYYSDQLESQMNRRWALALDRTINKLSRVDQNRNIQFHCKEGLFSASDGNYMASDPYFVDWGPIPEIRRQANFHFYCRLPEKDLTLLLRSGLDLVFKVEFSENSMSTTGLLYYALFQESVD